MRENNILKEKSMDFAEKIISLYKDLAFVKKEYVLSRQILRSGTSIGANVVEAVHGQSTPDFLAKLKIADKESAETEYWLELLRRGAFVDVKTCYGLQSDLNEIRSIIVASCKTTQENMEKAKAETEAKRAFEASERAARIKEKEEILIRKRKIEELIADNEKQMINKVRIYAGNEHENQAQKPEVWEVK